MQNDIYNLIAIGVIGNLIAYDFLPIQSAKQRFIGFFSTFFFYSSLDKLLNCSKCVAFWTALLYYQSITHAALAGFLGYIVNYINDRIANWYE